MTDDDEQPMAQRPAPGGHGAEPQWRQGQVDGSEASGHSGGRRGGRPSRRLSSRVLHRVGDLTSHSWAGLIVAAAVLGWVAVGVGVEFPGWWVAVLEVTSSAVTLIMVFAIQHTQARQESATQRKLDELLRALPSADDRLIAVEQAPDAELQGWADLNVTDRSRALDTRPHDASGR